MDAKTWQMAKEWIADLADLPESEWDDYLARHCSDLVLRERVRAMLGEQLSVSRILASAAFQPGTHIGPYEIDEAIGAGEMGEVYRARDLRLGRSVAIKVLPPLFTEDRERLARFEREARVLASLNHPHIAQIYDVEEAGGHRALVMELVNGETLADRMRRGPVPLADALLIARQIAEALEAAHDQGIIHRDLKPANISVRPDGTVKVLDFGLAKIVDTIPVSAGGNSPALRARATEEGLILGTAAYMSPEQASGKPVDRRTDLWAFGALFMEMLTGRPVFGGDTVSHVLAAILTAEPNWSTLPPSTPAGIQRLLRRCLQKDSSKRIDSGAVAAFEIEDVLSGSAGTPSGSSSAHHKRWERLSWLVAAALFLLTIAAGAAWWTARDRRLVPMYFKASVPFAATDLALSPNGRILVMVAHLPQTSNNALWLQQIGGKQPVLLNGTQGASYPFWSPNGQSIGFFADGKLRKVDVSGGEVQTLCDAANGRGGTWNTDDVILFTPNSLDSGLYRVPAAGGSPVEVTKLDQSRFESSHRWPVFLPDGKHFLYLAANFIGKPEYNAVFVGSLDSNDRHLIVSTTANVAYARSGFLLYLRDKALVAQPFDLRHYVLSGDAHMLTDEVDYYSQVDRAVFSAGEDVLVTQAGNSASISQLTWFDRSGKPGGTVGMPATAFNVRLSPNESRIAEAHTDSYGRTDIWVDDRERPLSRLTFEQVYHRAPVWNPNGKQIVFAVNTTLGTALFLKNSDGTGPEEPVVDLGPGDGSALDWSRDGKYVLFIKANYHDLAYLKWPEREAKPLLHEDGEIRTAQFSPDGRWIAYAANEGGRMEIYVKPFPNVDGGKWQVSTAGGQEPRWRRDGKELFYVSPEGNMIAVEVTTSTAFRAVKSVALFPTHRRQTISSTDLYSYDVTGNGQRFLIDTAVDDVAAAPLYVLLNWTLNWTSEIQK